MGRRVRTLCAFSILRGQSLKLGIRLLRHKTILTRGARLALNTTERGLEWNQAKRSSWVCSALPINKFSKEAVQEINLMSLKTPQFSLNLICSISSHLHQLKMIRPSLQRYSWFLTSLYLPILALNPSLLYLAYTEMSPRSKYSSIREIMHS